MRMGSTQRFLAGCGITLLAAGQAMAQAFGFSAPTNLATGAPGLERVRVAADGDIAVAVWEQERGDDIDAWDVWYARTTDRGATWSAPVNLTNLADSGLEDNIRPRIATAGGRWVIVWTDTTQNNGDLKAFVSDNVATAPTAAAITWTGPIDVHDDGGSDDEEADVALVTDGAGTWMAVWEKVYDAPPMANNASDLFASTSVDDGLTWSAEIQVSNMPGDIDGNPDTSTEDGDPGIAFGDGVWVASWKSGDAAIGPQSDEDIFISTSNNGMTWTAPRAVAPWESTDSGDDDNPAITFSPADGNFIVVWHSEVPDGGRGADFDIIAGVANSSNLASWTAVSVNNAEMDQLFDNDESPYPAADAFGNIFVTFGSIGLDATDYDIDVARSTDGGTTWTSDGPIQVDAGNDDVTESTIGASAAGTFYASWQGDNEASSTVSVLDLATSGGGSTQIIGNPTLVEEGDLLTLTAPAGTGHAWFRNGAPMSDTARITGTDMQVLTFAPALEQDAATYTVQYDDGTKAIVTSAPYELFVYPAGSLPAAAPIALAMLALALAGGTIYTVRTRKQ